MTMRDVPILHVRPWRYVHVLYNDQMVGDNKRYMWFGCGWCALSHCYLFSSIGMNSKLRLIFMTNLYTKNI